MAVGSASMRGIGCAAEARVMRYSLATLVILTLVLPPLLAFLWIARPQDFMIRLASRFGLPGIVLYFELVTFTFLYSPGRMARLVRVHPAMAFVLWCFETLALWLWTVRAIGVLGWILIWGDKGPPFSDGQVRVVAIFTGACLSGITSRRIVSGRATTTYVIIVSCMTAALLIFVAPYYLHHLSLYGRIPSGSY